VPRTTIGAVDEQRIGRTLRVLRHRFGWRQVDVSRAAKLSQDDISRGERGRMRDVAKLRRHAAALDADFTISIRWRGGDLDRLVDEGHAQVVGWVVALLSGFGWEVRTEISYSFYGERGSIDVLAWHAQTRTLLVVEVKTELTSLEETLRKHDEKQRLAAQIAKERLGWERPAGVCRMLVLPETSTARRRVARHAAVLDRAYRLRGAAARSWLRSPDGAPSLLVFASRTQRARTNRSSVSRKRICRSRLCAE
jgi:transcriptional regulator with XRE-family HTH domain